MPAAAVSIREGCYISLIKTTSNVFTFPSDGETFSSLQSAATVVHKWNKSEAKVKQKWNKSETAHQPQINDSNGTISRQLPSNNSTGFVMGALKPFKSTLVNSIEPRIRFDSAKVNGCIIQRFGFMSVRFNSAVINSTVTSFEYVNN